MRRIFLILLLSLAWGGLSGCDHREHSGATTPKYQCPMHPTVVSDRPGSCPICGMDLVPIQSGGPAPAQGPKSSVPGLAVISIPEPKRQLMGLKLATVEKRPLAREVRTSARLVSDETRLWRVTTKIEGWVEQLFIAYTGQPVEKGAPLLTIYSPDLVSAQAEYLAALRAQGNAGAEASRVSGSLLAAARRRLELWDVTDEQVERLTRTRQVEKTLTLYAPAGGVVLERNVLAGEKITQGNPLMVIADLSVLWADADIYQSDLPHVREGMPLEMSLPYWPGKVFEGKVIFVSPTIDPESRTLRARLEIPNPELLLKPGMYGDARLSYGLGEKLSIPASAVMVGAQQTYAFRDTGDGHVVPVAIKVGIRSGEYYELLEGLNAGDQVVASANFLVDSESNLKAALEALGAGPSTPSTDHQHPSGQAPGDLPAAEFERLLPIYLRLQAALAADDLDKSRSVLAELRPGAEAKSIEEARAPFKQLSDDLIAAAHKHGSASPLYILECGEVKQKIGP